MPRDTQKDPIRLLKKIVDKDRGAFEDFYDLLSPLVFSLILRTVRSKPDAEELLQDVFYYVWEKAANFDASRGTPAGWVITIARSRAIDRLRSRQRLPKTIEPLNDLTEEMLAPDNSSKEILYLRDERSFLEKELQKLSEIQRESLEMAYFEGLTQSEIAQRLELPLGTVKTRIRDGLKHLQGIFQKNKTGQTR